MANFLRALFGRKAGTCPLCSCLMWCNIWIPKRGWPTLDEARYFLFHQPCARCHDLFDGFRCGYCKHLRLCHLTHEGISAKTSIELNFGRVQDIRQRSEDCEFCRMITQEMGLEGCNPDVDFNLQVDLRSAYRDLDFIINVQIYDLSGRLEYRSFGGIFDSSQVIDDPSTKRTIWQQPMVDWRTVHTWLEECDREHGNLCDNGPLKSPPRGFRVIDTERGCVVMAPPACRYATLSYVWGRTTDTCALATTSTIQALEEEGYLFKKPLPATIRDSILACSELRIRYLWIDRLCIVQDDTSTVRDSQINAMGDIYSHSYLTLVDLEGISMDHGLPGVSQARPGRMVYEAQGMSLRVKDDDIHHTLVNSKWGSRGWTFQEAMLSPRTLLFTDVGVHFECSQAAQEDRFAQLTSKNILFTPAQDYHMLVHDFTSRTLTLNADVLRAFSGIMHWKYGTEQYFGLPYCGFVESMLWCPRTLSDYETTVARSAEAGDIFPTWSWSSIMGPIRYPSAIDTHTLLGVWGIPSFTTGELVHIIRPHSVSADPTPQWNKHTSLRGLGIALAWKEGCFPEPLPPMLNVSTPWKGYEALIRSGWESVDKLNEEALGIASIQGIEDFERIFSSSYREHADRPGTLLAHTQSLRARVVQCEEVKDGSHWRFWYVHTVLHSMHGDKVDVWIQSNPTHWQFLNHDYSKDHCTKLDVLALTMCDDRNIEFAHLNRDEEGRWYDSEGGALCLENGHELGFLVNVLIVETRDGLSRRVAIGVVELHHWISASPEFRDFSLI